MMAAETNNNIAYGNFDNDDAIPVRIVIVYVESINNICGSFDVVNNEVGLNSNVTDITL